MEVAVMHILLLFMLSILSHQKFSNANDTINTTQSIRGNETLVSRNFEMGFFSLGNSSNWYVGIWYKDITPKTVVWVANREIPLKNTTSSIFKVIPPGLLVILNETNNVIWSSNNSGSAKKPVAQLLDTGNLVLRDEDNLHPDNHLWQSFDHPTNTYLPGMVIQKMSSWKSDEDPSPGDFTASLDRSGYPQVFTTKNGVVYYRRGPWNGVSFSGTPNLRRDSPFTTAVRRNKEGDFYYKGHSTDTSVISRFTLSSTGVGERWTWVHRTHEWVRFLNFPEGAEFPFSVDLQIIHVAGSHPETQNQDLELPMFDLSTISKATDSFSFRNRIGEGGYGPVYKGTLADGRNIAVKRLSKDSHQGPDEFKNEVICIAKLQHRNLVKLLGFCVQGDDKMLIYEYMINKSLDLVLFGENRKLYFVSSRE